jgi:hypothetical protein
MRTLVSATTLRARGADAGAGLTPESRKSSSSAGVSVHRPRGRLKAVRESYANSAQTSMIRTVPLRLSTSSPSALKVKAKLPDVTTTPATGSVRNFRPVAFVVTFPSASVVCMNEPLTLYSTVCPFPVAVTVKLAEMPIVLPAGVSMVFTLPVATA